MSRSVVSAVVLGGAALVLASLVAPVGAQSPSPSGGGGTPVTDADGFAGAMPLDVAVGPDGTIVMVGQKADDPIRPEKAVAWTSPDGTTWTQVALPKGANIGAEAVSQAPGGFFAVGSGPFGSGITGWSSADGTTWRAAKLPKIYALDAATGDATEVVLAGSLAKNGKTSPTLWTSQDLKKWTTTKLPGNGGVDAVALDAGGRIAALVCDRSADASVCAPTILLVTPGADPVTVPLPLPVAGSTQGVADIGFAGDQLVIALDTRPASGPATGTILVTPDGSAPTVALTGLGLLQRVASGPVATVVGSTDLVSSADGVTWVSGSATAPGALMGAAVLPDATIIAVGYVFNNGFHTFTEVLPALVAPPATPTGSPAASAAPGSASSPAA